MFAIDASHMLHRIMHTPQFDELSRSGQRLGGVSGFIKSVEALCSREGQGLSGIVLAWDLNCSDYRCDLLPSYKKRDTDEYTNGMIDIPKIKDAKRRDWEAVYDLNRQILHEQVLPNLGCISLQIKGVEADDILYQLVRYVPDFKLVVSGDRDLLQLVSNNSHVLNPSPKRRKVYTPQSLCEEYDLIPEMYRSHFLLMKAMVGDTSDNIEGIEGVSFKTGSKFARSILEHKGFGGLKPEKAKRDRALIEGFERVQRNLKLMDLYYLPQPDVQKIVTTTYRAANLLPAENAERQAVYTLKQLGLENDVTWNAHQIAKHNFNSNFRERIKTGFEPLLDALV